MGVYKRDDCIGCETCIKCGRHKPRIVAYCDGCGKEGYRIYRFGNKMLCIDCIAESHTHVENDVDCIECNEDYAKVKYGGESLCMECFERRVKEDFEMEGDYDG